MQRKHEGLAVTKIHIAVQKVDLSGPDAFDFRAGQADARGGHVCRRDADALVLHRERALLDGDVSEIARAGVLRAAVTGVERLHRGLVHRDGGTGAEVRDALYTVGGEYAGLGDGTVQYAAVLGCGALERIERGGKYENDESERGWR